MIEYWFINLRNIVYNDLMSKQLHLYNANNPGIRQAMFAI